MLAMVAVGRFASVPEAAEAMVHLGERTPPDTQAHARYQAWRPLHRQLYPALAQVFGQIQTVSKELGEI